MMQTKRRLPEPWVSSSLLGMYILPELLKHLSISAAAMHIRHAGHEQL